MPTEHINYTDVLQEGTDKLNKAIDQANKSEKDSSTARQKSEEALDKSNSTQTQLDTIVIEGDSSVEAAQARVDEKGESHTTLKARIDDGFERTTSQLAQITINAKMPPAPLQPVKLDGASDDTVALQAILDYAGVIGGGTVLVPEGSLSHSVLYIPDNVTLKGVGIGKTILKLMDNCPLVSQRIPTGIYPKRNVTYFAVEDLTYDGNTENNVDISQLDNTDYTNYYAHGILNSYVDETTNTNNPDPLDKRNADDFLIRNVHVKNVLRNNLLISGRTTSKGLVENAILENSYGDHLIYESLTDSRVLYRNVTFKGFWRGEAIVVASGDFSKPHFTGIIQNPVPDYSIETLLDFRNNFKTQLKHNPNITNITIDVPFALVSNLFNLSNSTYPIGVNIDNLIVNQTDDSLYGKYGTPISLATSMIVGSLHLRNVELNNISQMNLLSVRHISQDITIENVTFNYKENRPSITEDAILRIDPRYEGIVNDNIVLENIRIKEKAPSLILFTEARSINTYLTNTIFRKLDIAGNGNTPLFVLVSSGKFIPTNVNIVDSNISNYPTIDYGMLESKNISLVNTKTNSVNSKRGESVKLTLNNGWTGDVFFSKDENGIVWVRTTNLRPGLLQADFSIGNIPAGYSPLNGFFTGIPAFNSTKKKAIPYSIVISGSTSQIMLYAPEELSANDIVRFSYLYKI